MFALPFLWMVSSGFKDLETIFEYPPTLLPMETQTQNVNGKHVPLGTYRNADGRPELVLILDRRPGETQVAAAGAAESPKRWVPSKTVSLRRNVHFRWENYPTAWTSEPFSLYTLNTLIITSLGIIGQAVSASLVAFGFARLEWPGRNILFLLLLSTMMLPQEVTMIPSFLIFRQLGWIDTFLPLIVPAFLGGGAFSIFLFRQFFLSLPRELDDAARVDGCGSFGIYLYILMPLCKPIIATIAVFSFVAHWNDFLTPLIYLNSSDKFTLAVGLRFFQGAYGTDMHLLMAASTLALIPVLLVFFVGQKYFVRSIVMSGVKG
jgi:ABC-type glycerol-3-phosphate transport system permease component